MKRRSVWEYVIAAQVLGVVLLVGYMFWRNTTPGLIFELQFGNANLKAEAAAELAREGPSASLAIPVLKELLQEPNSPVQFPALQALGQIGGAAALVDAMRSPDGQVRRGAIEVLSRLPKPNGEDLRLRVRIFSDALLDPDHVVREKAAYGLGWLGPDASAGLPALRDAAKDPDPQVSTAAVGAVAAIGSVEDLTALLTSPNQHVRGQAIIRMPKFGAALSQRSF